MTYGDVSMITVDNGNVEVRGRVPCRAARRPVTSATGPASPRGDDEGVATRLPARPHRPVSGVWTWQGAARAVRWGPALYCRTAHAVLLCVHP